MHIMNALFMFGVASILYSVFLFRRIIQYSSGGDKMKEISSIIQKSSYAYIFTQSKYILIVTAIIATVLFFLFSFAFALCFVIGAFLSCLSGFIGMYISVNSNARTAHGASNSLEEGFNIAVQAGGAIAFLVTGLAILGFFICSTISIIFNYSDYILGDLAISFCLGASLTSTFARLGGGIFTKAADVGADLVGKIEAGIPEDDIRNPAVVADNVGDNVGDCAGMASDIFETYVVIFFSVIDIFDRLDPDGLPYHACMILMVGLISSYFGFKSIKLRGENIISALYRGLTVYTIMSCVLFGIIYFNEMRILIPALMGPILTILIMKATEYYTSDQYPPVKGIAKASEAGHGTNVIQGLAVSLESCAIPALLIVLGITLSNYFAGQIGICVASISLLSSSTMIIIFDGYGPVTDNAGGIVEMSEMHEVRQRTDILDAAGNITKAVTKGYAICIAGIASLILLRLYKLNLSYDVIFDILDVNVLSGVFIGAGITYLFASFSMRAVGEAGASVVEIVRDQFRENPGIMNNTTKPDYEKVISLLTKTSVKKMIAPALLSLSPAVALLITGSVSFVCGLLVGNTITGIFIAISMTSGGGAWDNAKKYIERHYGKKSLAYEAAVTGDTVGDPYKDTAGPAINPLIKSMNIVAITSILLFKCSSYYSYYL